MRNKVEFIIEKHLFGWIVKAPPGERGVPSQAIQSLALLMPKTAVMSPGVANHYDAVFAAGMSADVMGWEADIEETMAKESCHEYAWYRGTKTGLSSMTMFAALANQQSGWTMDAKDRVGRGYVPSDAPDFDRCEYLLCKFPEWRSRLAEVDKMFPGMGWDKLAANWERLTKIAGYDDLTKAMREVLR
jgi:hypothetical protein